jgi:hypothetical protein
MDNDIYYLGHLIVHFSEPVPELATNSPLPIRIIIRSE